MLAHMKRTLSTSCQHSEIETAPAVPAPALQSSVRHVCGHSPCLGCCCICTGGSDADGTESAGALAQGTFQTMARAADDMGAVFADDPPELSSLLLTWALQVRPRPGLRAYSAHVHVLARHQALPGLVALPPPRGLSRAQWCCMQLYHYFGVAANLSLKQQLLGMT